MKADEYNPYGFEYYQQQPKAEIPAPTEKANPFLPGLLFDALAGSRKPYKSPLPLAKRNLSPTHVVVESLDLDAPPNTDLYSYIPGKDWDAPKSLSGLRKPSGILKKSRESFGSPTMMDFGSPSPSTHHTITVFGFPKKRSQVVHDHFASHGQILSVKFSSDPDVSWMVVQYASKNSVLSALEWDGQVHESFMIAVKQGDSITQIKGSPPHRVSFDSMKDSKGSLGLSIESPFDTPSKPMSRMIRGRNLESPMNPFEGLNSVQEPLNLKSFKSVEPVNQVKSQTLASLVSSSRQTARLPSPQRPMTDKPESIESFGGSEDLKNVKMDESDFQDIKWITPASFLFRLVDEITSW